MILLSKELHESIQKIYMDDEVLFYPTAIRFVYLHVRIHRLADWLESCSQISRNFCRYYKHLTVEKHIPKLRLAFLFSNPRQCQLTIKERTRGFGAFDDRPSVSSTKGKLVTH